MPEKEIVKYKNFILDQFQIDAIEAVKRHNSVVVSAATGTGKTLTADFVIDRFLKQEKRVIYTSPIKALSNQKFKQFKEEYGEENVGIMTGDVVINPSAAVVIMTTEIYRNMLLSKDIFVDDISYVIFDEIHYISDIERGTVWEESIIFSPPHIRFLCLSATIPNSREFADWIESIKGHTVEVVEYLKRAVPLTHKVYDLGLGICDLKEMNEIINVPDYDDIFSRRGRNRRNRGKRPFSRPPDHTELAAQLAEEGFLPAIHFIFSRAATQKKAGELAKKKQLLTAAEKGAVTKFIIDFFNSCEQQIRTLRTTKLLRMTLSKGIGFHHAGLLPKLKELVELLFEKGLVKILYATETFAVGINMPAKTVCFDSLEKYDGKSFRYLTTGEYMQLAGRAGRRGIDKEGLVVAMIHRQFVDLDKVKKVTTGGSEPIISRFALSYNTVLNTIRSHTQEEIDIILKSNFDYYQNKSKNKEITYKANFKRKKTILTKMGFIEGDALTHKGGFACHIYSQEILTSEIFATPMKDKLSDFEIFWLLASIAYEPRRADTFKKAPNRAALNELLKKTFHNKEAKKKIDPEKLLRLYAFCKAWWDGTTFLEMLPLSNLLEGDIIRLFRQVLDRLGQIKRATQEERLRERINTIIGKINREFVRVEF